MDRLVPHVQHYEWGSTTAIPGMLGVEPDGRPWAELWVGDHPRLPSTVASTGAPLDAGLPFLLKVLAADQPLSIQTHPSLEQARVGFARENAAGVPIDAPDRVYRDPNHKPELICALTSFDALVGFRRPLDVLAEHGHLAAFEPVAERLAADDEAEALAESLRFLLRLDPADAADLVERLAVDVELVARLSAAFPGDPGAVVALLLHRVRLEPGEAVLLGAGNLHAYLSGVGVELMANSDNVIRGGLTAKHIDVDELLSVVSCTPFEPRIQHATGPVHRYDTEGVGFELTRAEVSGSSTVESAPPELVLLTSGAIDLVEPEGTRISLRPGDAAFVGRATTYTIEGDGLAWRAFADGRLAAG